MRKARTIITLALWAVSLHACRTYTDDLLHGAGGAGGQSATGGTMTTGGAGPGAAGGQQSTPATTAGGGGTGGNAALVNGQPCGMASQCSSMHCVDGVCCEQECIDTCSVCNDPNSAGSCTAIADGEDPDDECGDDTCNGAGSCRCTDGQLSPTESDIDCGGTACPSCDDGKACNDASDCSSGVCMTTCQPPSCTDQVKNGDETSTDCGGSCPNGCPDGADCQDGKDCLSQVCVAGSCQAGVCGDGFVNAPNENCDDGATESFDGCSASCQLPAQHLLLSEVVIAPSNAEMIEIYNPTAAPVALDNYYLADFNTYHAVTTASAVPNSTDFLARFPMGSSIPAGGFVAVSLQSATAFHASYGKNPSFDFDDTDNGSPAMLGSFGPNSGLTNTGEMVMLFHWDGVSELVSDIDYVLFGNTSNAVDKTGIMVGQSTYASDTAAFNQIPAKKPDTNKSLHRCDTAESSETKSGGNGKSGHDETSEDNLAAWKLTAGGSPLAPPEKKICP